MSTKGSYHLLYNTKMKNSKDKSECHNICFKIRYFCRFSLKKKKKKKKKKDFGRFSISDRLEVRFPSYGCFIGFWV